MASEASSPAMATTCTALGDKAVHSILLNLQRDQVEKFRDEIALSLADFSSSEERKYQPDSSMITRPDGRSILFRPFTSRSGPGVKIIVDPTTPAALQNSAAKSGQKPTLHGILVICDADGLPKGLINADEITAFRTSMSVMIPYSWRRSTARVVIFGAGKVALWHARLMLALRGDEISSIVIINRSVGRADELISQVRRENETLWKSAVVLETLESGDSNNRGRLEELVSQADVICCTTPSSKPLFSAHCVGPADHHTQSPKFISGIGSWQPEMTEMDPELFRNALNSRNGAVIVDDRLGAMQVSGEIIQSGLRAEQVLEIGEILASRMGQLSDGGRAGSIPEAALQHKLAEGLIVYKSIGVSMTDLAAASAVLALAREQKQGVEIADF